MLRITPPVYSIQTKKLIASFLPQVLRPLVPLPGRLRHRRQLRGGSRAARPGGGDRVARRRAAALALRQDRARGLGRAGRGHGGAAEAGRGA